MTAPDEVFRVPKPVGDEDPTPEPGKGGRPPHAPSGENRRQVRYLASRLMPQEAIAAVLGICDDTLRKHCEAELREGEGRGCLKVAESLDKLLEAGGEKAILQPHAGQAEADRDAQARARGHGQGRRTAHRPGPHGDGRGCAAQAAAEIREAPGEE